MRKNAVLYLQILIWKNLPLYEENYKKFVILRLYKLPPKIENIFSGFPFPKASEIFLGGLFFISFA